MSTFGTKQTFTNKWSLLLNHAERNSKAATMNGMLNRPAKFKKHLPLDCSTLDFLALVGR